VPAISKEIPLFPLPTVLFPGTFLPLRITDESQRSLLRDCVDQGDHLGVILNPGGDGSGRPSVPCTTGCLATVALLLRDDNEFQPMNAVLRGERRIRVVDYVQQDPYLTGRIEMLDDHAGLNATRHTKQAARLFQKYIDLVRLRYQAEVADLTLPDDPTLASYLLASVLYLPIEMKQHWLESASATIRLKEELAFLQAECERMAVFQTLSQKKNQQYSTPDIHLYTTLISQN
jgi:Lon protease-like protein